MITSNQLITLLSEYDDLPIVLMGYNGQCHTIDFDEKTQIVNGRLVIDLRSASRELQEQMENK